MNELVAETLVTIATGAVFMTAVIATLIVATRDRPPIVRDNNGRWRPVRRR